MEQHYRRRHPNKCVALGVARHSLSPTADESEESDESPDMTAPADASKKANLNVIQELYYSRLNQLRREKEQVDRKKEQIDDEMDALQKVIRHFEQPDFRNS